MSFSIVPCISGIQGLAICRRVLIDRIQLPYGQVERSGTDRVERSQSVLG